MNAVSTSSATSGRYTGVAMLFHWVLAVAILGAFSMALYVDELPLSPTKLKLLNWHKWAGVSILVLSVLRLLWRLSHRPPALPTPIERAMPGWQLGAYHAVHHLMYLLFFVVPLLGWAYSSAHGYPIVWFGVLPLPDFVPVDKALAAAIKPWHEISAFALIGLVALHVAAALKHQFIDRDGLISRMLPGSWGR
ncbi:MAG: cytochrome b [Burkholderiales bacterium]|nr:cytochrome b [Burkholderiales bacterium]